MVFDFRAGRRAQALDGLDSALAAAEKNGLVVPRIVYTYEETTVDKVFKADVSLSEAGEFLNKSGTFQIGLGVRTGGVAGGEMKVAFSDPSSTASMEEAARVYGHAAVLDAVYHYAAGSTDKALGAAHRAVATWALGARLGEDMVPVADKTAQWANDGVAAIAIAAQQAVEAGHIFLAGDLWTLARDALGADADDAAVVVAQRFGCAPRQARR